MDGARSTYQESSKAAHVAVDGVNSRRPGWAFYSGVTTPPVVAPYPATRLPPALPPFA
jgi:hypothetical protein